MVEHGASPRGTSSGLSALSRRLMRNLSSAAVKNKDVDLPAAAAGGESRSAGNLVFSPLSMYSALSLVAAGAKGRTLSELLDALGAKSRESLAEDVRCMVGRALPAVPHPDGGPGVAVAFLKKHVLGTFFSEKEGVAVAHACGVWHDAATGTLKPAYRDVAAASCNAVARAVDFLNKPEEARKRINSWVAAATNNLVDSILPPGSVHRDTSLVVTTAIYFKGIWATTFDKSLTKTGKFHRLDGTAVDAQFMRSNEDQLIAAHDGFKVLVMPYAAAGTAGTMPSAVPSPSPSPSPPPPHYSMCVLLPDARDGLPSLVETMTTHPCFLQEHMPGHSVQVGDFRVPKFKLSFYTGMKGQLEDLGIKAVFDPTGADLTNMLQVQDGGDGDGLFLGEVFHRAVIEVNEEGTEAAVATAALGRAGCAGPQRRPKAVDFVADHPFAFFVVEEVSGAILFAGQVLDPTKP